MGFEKLYHLIFECMGHTCHQIPERSFFIFGVQMPLCCRCTGLYLGGLVFIVLLLKRKLPGMIPVFVLLSVAFMDFTLKKWTGWDGTNIIRFFTGTAYGFAAPALLLYFINRIKQGLSFRFSNSI